VSSAAAFVGARLQYPLPECNSRRPRVSTIRVDQHKAKCGFARIYCTLAHEDEVAAAWRELHGAGPHAADASARWDEHKDRCMLHDAVHYRRCYMDMVALVPDLRERLCSQADYEGLLQANFEGALAWLTNLPVVGCLKYGAVDKAGVERVLRAAYA